MTLALARSAYRFANAATTLTSLIATPPQQLKVFYGGARSGDNGGPLVKARLLKNHFPDTRFGFSLVYLLSNAIYLPDLAIESIRRRRIPIVLNQNGVFYPAWYRGDWQRENARMATAYHQASHVFWQSQFCRRCANRFLGERSGSGEVLLNATDIDHFVPRAERNSQDSYVLLVTGKIGHLTAYRLESSIAGVAEARRGGLDVMLRIAGIVDPAVEAEMRAKAETLGILDAVNFSGPYTRLEAPAIYQSADAYLMTKHNDPCPNAVIEAMASGLPVLYSASGGVPELVGDAAGVGLPVEESFERSVVPSASALADGIDRIIEGRAVMSSAARQRAVERFGLQNWIGRHASVFNRLIAEIPS